MTLTDRDQAILYLDILLWIPEFFLDEGDVLRCARFVCGWISIRGALFGARGMPLPVERYDAPHVSRHSPLLKSTTYFVSEERNADSASGAARVGCAAIIHEGHGVGTEPIYMTVSFLRFGRGKTATLTKRTSPRSNHGFVVNHSHMKALVEPSFTEATRL